MTIGTTDTTTETPESTAYTKAEQAHYEQIRQKEREVGKLASRADDTKRTASAAKKAFEAADEELREFIHVGLDLQQKLPGMDGVKPSEEWRELPLSDLGLGDFYTGKLADVKVTTIGDLSDWMTKHGDQWWRDIPGIADGKAETIAGCFADFWAAHPEYCESPVAQPSEPVPAGRIRIKLLRDIIGESDNILAGAGEIILAIVDKEGDDWGEPYFIDPSDDEPVYLTEGDYETVA